MDATVIQQMISTVGFPIFVAAYMLIVQQKESRKNSENIAGMTAALNMLKDAIDRIGDKKEVK